MLFIIFSSISIHFHYIGLIQMLPSHALVPALAAVKSDGLLVKLNPIVNGACEQWKEWCRSTGDVVLLCD